MARRTRLVVALVTFAASSACRRSTPPFELRPGPNGPAAGGESLGQAIVRQPGAGAEGGRWTQVQVFYRTNGAPQRVTLNSGTCTEIGPVLFRDNGPAAEPSERDWMTAVRFNEDVRDEHGQMRYPTVAEVLARQYVVVVHVSMDESSPAWLCTELR